MQFWKLKVYNRSNLNDPETIGYCVGNASLIFPVCSLGNVYRTVNYLRLHDRRFCQKSTGANLRIAAVYF